LAASPSAAAPFRARLGSVPYRRFELPAAIDIQPNGDVFGCDIPHVTGLPAPNQQQIARLEARGIAEHLYFCDLKYQVHDPRSALPEGYDRVTAAHHGLTGRQQQRIVRVECAQGLELIAPKRLDKTVMKLLKPCRIFTRRHASPTL
jgi:hypothetical protein